MPYRPTIILSLVAWCRVAVNALFEPVRFFVDAAQGEPTSRQDFARAEAGSSTMG